MFYISDSDSDEEFQRNEKSNSRKQEPDLSSISNPFSQSFSGGMDMTQQQKLQRMKQAAQRQSMSQISMVSGSTMMSSANKRNSSSFIAGVSGVSGTKVQMFDQPYTGIIDNTRPEVDEYTLREDEQRRPRFSGPDQPKSHFDQQNGYFPQQQNSFSQNQYQQQNSFSQNQYQQQQNTYPPQNFSNQGQFQNQYQQQGQPQNIHPLPPQNMNTLQEAPIEPHNTNELEKQLQNRGISPTVYEAQEEKNVKSRLPELDISDRPRFLSHTIPKDYGLVKCYVIRERGKFSLFPKYHLYYENGNQFLLSARKRKKNKSSNYLMSLDRDDLSRRSNNYFGKLRSNFVGTEFIIYNNGGSPTDKDLTSIRHEMGAILYETNILGTRGPRRLNIITPGVESNGEYKTHPQTKGSPSLIQQYKENDRKNIHVFTNKKPAWNEKLKAYVLNFNGRVTKASVKNFQLVEEGSETVILQFGKVSDNRFSLDYRYPLCALQAFAIALSAYDFKLMCE